MSAKTASIRVLVLLALAAPRAAAQPGKPTPAEAIFREGREAAARGDMTTACAKFEESVRLARAPGPLLNLADCDERSGRLVSAAKHWKEGIDLLEPKDDRRPFAEERLAALEKRLPRLTVRVMPDAPGARVEIDGAEVPPSEIKNPQPVDPGNHKVAVKAGERSGQADVSIAEGDQREVVVTLKPERAAAPPPEPSTAMRTAGFITAGVGVVGLAVFGVTAGILASHNAAVQEGCNEKKQCTPEGLSAAESGKTLTPVNTVGLIVGVAGVAAGVTLIVLSPSPSRPAVALRAAAAPSAFSASIEGTF